jgi:hypothetical protein
LVRNARDSTVAALSSPNVPSLGAPTPLPEVQPPLQRAPFAQPQPQPRANADAASRSAANSLTKPPAAPAPPAMPVPRVTASPLQQVAQATPQPAFEEMAVPAPGPKTTPLALTPRNLDTGPAAPATFRVAPRSAQPPVAAPAPVLAPIPASLPKAQPIPKAPPEASAAPLGGKVVQLGAFRSRAEAEKALGNWRRDVPALFQRISEPAIVTADLGEKGVFYRVRVPGFADSRRASEFCREYKGPGRDCYVVP